MNEPWHGSQPPETLVTVTLPYNVVKRVLSAVVRDAQRTNSKGNDPEGVALLAKVSDVLGDAISAPAHRRFRLPNKLYHAVIAGTEAEYRRWLAEDDNRRAIINLIYVGSVEAALGLCYSGSSTVGTWYKRDDAQELLAAVKARTFKQ